LIGLGTREAKARQRARRRRHLDLGRLSSGEAESGSVEGVCKVTFIGRLPHERGYLQSQ